LAGLLQNTGRYEDAETLYREALEIYRRLATQNPSAYEPDVETTFNNLENLLQSTRRYEDAENLYQEVLEIRRRLADQNPGIYELYVATTCKNLALFQFDIKKEKTAAEALFKEALTIYEKYPHLARNAELVRQILSAFNKSHRKC
jgi:tetratricopeptide (TPR) repeat protein